MKHQSATPMLITKCAHVIFFMQIETASDDGSEQCTISTLTSCHLEALLMPSNARHMLLVQLGIGSARGTLHNTRREIVTECHTLNHDRLQVWNYFKTVMIVS